MKKEQKPFVISNIDGLAEAAFPSDPNRIYKKINEDLVERAKKMNSLLVDAESYRRMGLDKIAEEIEEEIAILANPNGLSRT
jgi:hypothetical protein